MHLKVAIAGKATQIIKSIPTAALNYEISWTALVE